jgi:branched-chain amino acid transport system substrate-binding protein
LPGYVGSKVAGVAFDFSIGRLSILKLLIIAFPVCVWQIGFLNGAASAEENLRLPFAATFSGQFAEIGTRVWREGLLPGVAEVNKRGGIHGRRLEFYKVDVRFPETAGWIAEFRRICKDVGIPIVFGIGTTKSTIAIFEDNRKCGLPVFSPFSSGAWPYKTGDGKRDFGCCLFRYQPLPDDVLPILIKTAKERLGIKTVALSHSIDDRAAVQNVRVSRKALTEIGIKIVNDLGFKNAETNLQPQTSSIRHSRADAIIMHHRPGLAGALLLQLRNRRVKTQVLTDSNIGSTDFWKQSQGKAKGSIGYSLYAADDPNPATQAWVKQWRILTGRKGVPDAFVTTYYDAVLVLAHVLNTAKSLSRKDIITSFLKVENHETLSGVITWSNVGDIFRPAPILVQMGDEGVLNLWK